MKNFTVRKYQQKQVHLFTVFFWMHLPSFILESQPLYPLLSKQVVFLLQNHPDKLSPGTWEPGFWEWTCQEKSCEDGLKTFLVNFKIESGHVQTQKGKQPFQTQMVILADQSLVGSPCGQAHSRVPLEMCCPASPVVPH